MGEVNDSLYYRYRGAAEGVVRVSKTSGCQVAVIGAGPYGLAASAHLKSAGLEVSVFGLAMEFWRNQMPAGMLLRSPWDASHIGDPNDEWTLDQFQRECGTELPRPVPLDDFVRYGLWFQHGAVSDLDTRRVERLEVASNGFRLWLATGEFVEAQHAVIAAGIGPFARRPAAFLATPNSLASHSSEHRDFHGFAGRRVIVVGGGQSAVESAALLREGGAEVELVVRRPSVRWLNRSALLHSKSGLRRVLYHRADVGPAILSQLVCRPNWLRQIPRALQQKFAERSIRPAAASWLAARVQGVQITTGRQVVSASPKGSEVSITLDDSTTRNADHIVLGTGYQVDLSRYEFLTKEVLRSLSQVDGYPRLSRNFESSLPGLYFVGGPAAWSFGPLMRFVAGTQFAARRLSDAIASKYVRRAI